MDLAKELDNIIIERTYNTNLVRSILCDKELLKRSAANSVRDFDPKIQQDIIYLLIIDNNELIGINVFNRFNNDTCAQGHVNYLPFYWGSGLEKYTKLSINWIFEYTDFKKICCFAPEYYPEVEKHALLSGLKVDCNFTDSCEKDGKLYNQKIMSIQKGGV